MNQSKTQIVEKRFDEIQTWMPTGQGTDLPDPLEGIYFMDGNILRKIVDQNGQKLPAFDNMLTKVQETCIVVGKNIDE